MFTRWHTPAPIPVIIDTPSRSHWLDPNPQDDPSESLFSQRPFGAGEFNQLARLLEDSHYMQSEMSPLDDLLLLQRYPESKHVYTCMARTMTRQEILNALSYIGAYKEEFDKRATQLLQRDHAHSVEYLKGVDYGGDPQNTIHYRTLIVPGGLDPTRHFGFEYTGVVPTRHYEFSQTRLSHACCAQPKGSPGCWISLDPDDIDMEITPYKLWYDLHSYHDLIHMNNDHLVNVISNGSQIGTAFLCAKTYIDLHNRIQTLLLELRDGLASMYRTKNHDAINLDSFLELLEAVRKFNAPQHICTVPWTHYTAEAHLIHIMKLGRTVVVVQPSRRIDPKPIEPERTDPKQTESERTKPENVPVVKSLPQKQVAKQKPKVVVDRIDLQKELNDMLKSLSPNDNIEYNRMRNNFSQINLNRTKKSLEREYNQVLTFLRNVQILQQIGQQWIDNSIRLSPEQKREFLIELRKNVNNNEQLDVWEAKATSAMSADKDDSTLKQIAKIMDRNPIHNDALMQDLEELRNISRDGISLNVRDILNQEIEKLSTMDLPPWWEVFDPTNSDILKTYRKDAMIMRLNKNIIPKAPLIIWQDPNNWAIEPVRYIASELGVSGEGSVAQVLSRIRLQVTPKSIQILDATRIDIQNQIQKIADDPRLRESQAASLQAAVLDIQDQLNQVFIDINRIMVGEIRVDKAGELQIRQQQLLQKLQQLNVKDELDRIEKEQREAEEQLEEKEEELVVPVIIDPLEAVLSALRIPDPDQLLAALVSIEDETTNKALIRGFLTLGLADINYGMLKEALINARDNGGTDNLQNMLECVNDETLNEHMKQLGIAE